MNRNEVAVVGGGPAGLMAADIISRRGIAVCVYDRMPSVGRKFLLAGRGGLNLTHSEELGDFLARYIPAASILRASIEAFPPSALREFAAELGEPTFVGTSGRVFPCSFKASPLLRAWLARLRQGGVRFALRHAWQGFAADGSLVFTQADGARLEVASTATVLALGGASWPRLGSDGSWQQVLERDGIAVAPLRPANCGFLVKWSQHFRDRFEGAPLKRIVLSFDGRRAQGELMITRDGLEGAAIYALSAPLREAILASGEATVALDLLPDADEGQLAGRLARLGPRQSISNRLRKAFGLSPAAVGLLHEAALAAGAPLAARDAEAIARLAKQVPLRLGGVAPLARAISTAGGVRLDELDGAFMVRRRPGVFLVGEMLDWEAPTGGYLLQGAFATGAAAGRGVCDWLAAQADAKHSPRATLTAASQSVAD